MFSTENLEIDGQYCPNIKSRWCTYGKYKLMIWMCSMNELSIVFTPTEISHSGLYLNMFIHFLAVIFVGIPVLYSEICLAQYTNCDIFTMWNFFPILRNVGYGTLYLIMLKSVYLLVLTAWYLLYTFYSALDTPPWTTCDDFAEVKCMVKRINVSTFQHCLETQLLFGSDCGMKTASYCFFEREISFNSTINTLHCFHPWKVLIAIGGICTSIFIFSIKKERLIQVIVHLAALYIGGVTIILCIVALSTNGIWYATKSTSNWNTYNFISVFCTISRAYFSLGIGTGIVISLSRDVSFRSPATMTAISTALFAVYISSMLSLIAYAGIKNMGYYHGEEENVIEVGTSFFFQMFASMSEILSYFNPVSIWTFLWFSVNFICLYINFWIIFLFLRDLVLHNHLANKYCKTSSMLLLIIIMICSLPFLCTDLTGSLVDVTEILQAISTFLFSISFYWIYGIKKHNVDIVFMIGIKANYYWKITWLLNPIVILASVYTRWLILGDFEFHDSYFLESLSITLDILVIYILVSIYGIIIFFGIVTTLIGNCSPRKLARLFSPALDWGPTDKTLFRSRNMFVPEIMTREFLYRQVRIHGYNKSKQTATKMIVEDDNLSASQESETYTDSKAS